MSATTAKLRLGQRTVVRLQGGPFEGARVSVNWGDPLAVQGHGVPRGMTASYRRSREQGVYSFRGFARVLATIPMPAGGAA